MHQQQAFRLSSDMVDFEIPGQVQQALIQARQQRIESELEANASIVRHYRALVGRGASSAQIAQGLRNVINDQATRDHLPVRDRLVLAEHARAEAERAREAEHDHFNSIPFDAAVSQHTVLAAMSDEQDSPS